MNGLSAAKMEIFLKYAPLAMFGEARDHLSVEVDKSGQQLLIWGRRLNGMLVTVTADGSDETFEAALRQWLTRWLGFDQKVALHEATLRAVRFGLCSLDDLEVRESPGSEWRTIVCTADHHQLSPNVIAFERKVL